MMTVDTQAVNLDSAVSFTNGNLVVGGLVVGSQTTDMLNFVQTCWPYVPTQYVVTASYPASPNRFEQAFRIVALLVEKKRVKDLTVASFISLVTEIAGAL